MLAQFSVTLFVLAASITAFAQIGVLGRAFDEGIKSALPEYSKDNKIKSEVDIIQLNHKCCGADNYTNWLKIAWTDHVNPSQ